MMRMGGEEGHRGEETYESDEEHGEGIGEDYQGEFLAMRVFWLWVVELRWCQWCFLYVDGCGLWSSHDCRVSRVTSVTLDIV
jgi:hypothetical protein